MFGRAVGGEERRRMSGRAMRYRKVVAIPVRRIRRK
uniref:Uncharacterized protein n=1 Tax=Arundo donax TaxID=35708 RepID=A0A0A8Z274_ARUDO